MDSVRWVDAFYFMVVVICYFDLMVGVSSILQLHEMSDEMKTDILRRFSPFEILMNDNEDNKGHWRVPFHPHLSAWATVGQLIAAQHKRRLRSSLHIFMNLVLSYRHATANDLRFLSFHLNLALSQLEPANFVRSKIFVTSCIFQYYHSLLCALEVHEINL